MKYELLDNAKDVSYRENEAGWESVKKLKSAEVRSSSGEVQDVRMSRRDHSRRCLNLLLFLVSAM